MNQNSVVAAYEVDGKIWKINVVEKGDSVYLPTAPDTYTHIFDGWKVSGTGDTLSGNTSQKINENIKFVADMVEKDWLKTSFNGPWDFYGNYIWTDGTTIYYSYDSEHCIFNGK